MAFAVFSETTPVFWDTAVVIADISGEKEGELWLRLRVQ